MYVFVFMYVYYYSRILKLQINGYVAQSSRIYFPDMTYLHFYYKYYLAVVINVALSKIEIYISKTSISPPPTFYVTGEIVIAGLIKLDWVNSRAPVVCIKLTQVCLEPPKKDSLVIFKPSFWS